jgi:hypothetical protein
LGFGVEIATALTPVILWLSQVAVDAIRSHLQTEIEGAVNSWFKRVVQNLKALFAGRAAPGQQAPQLPALTPAEIRHVRKIVEAKAVEVTKLPLEQAQRIADAIAASSIETA